MGTSDNHDSTEAKERRRLRDQIARLKKELCEQGEVLERLQSAQGKTTGHSVPPAAINPAGIDYAPLIEAMGAGVGVQDAKGIVAFVNDRLCEFLGYSKEEVLGRQATDFVDGQSHGALREEMTKRREGESGGYEIDLLCKSGETRPVLVTPVPLIDGEGNYGGSLALFVDIGERKETERALAELNQSLEERVRERTEGLAEANRRLERSEARFRIIFEAAPLGIAISDTDGYLRNLNPAAEELFGYSSEELRGTHFLDLTHPADAALSKDGLRSLLEGEQAPFQFERRYLRKDGSVFLGHMTLALVRDAQGKVQFIIGMLRAVTEQVLLEKERRRSEARIAGILESSHDAIVSVDAEQRIVVFSKSAERIFGYTQKEILGEPLDLLIPSDQVEAHRRHVEDFSRASPAARPMGEREISGRRKDGSTFPAEASISGLPLQDDLLMTAIVRDVTQQRKLEHRSRQAQKMEALGRLAGGVAHDFNNLLVGILVNADLVADDLDKTSEQHQRVQEILACGERATELTRQLLIFSRKQTARPVVQSLRRILADMDEILRRVIGEDITLTVAVHKSTGNVALVPGQLEQIILNLVLNARDAMPHGGKLSIRSRSVTVEKQAGGIGPKAGRHVLLEVADTGTGMDPETQAHAFEPFFTTKEATRGTGLGLSTVFAIVEQAGGHVDFDSRPRHGTVFTLHLPLASAAEEDSRAEIPGAELSQGSETVLVVEDDDIVRRLTAEILELNGYNVLAAHNAGEALLILEDRQRSIDLLLSDVVMPQMSGGVLAERATRDRPELKVLYMSGYTADALEKHGVEGEEFEILEKPFTPVELTAKVRHVLDNAHP